MMYYLRITDHDRIFIQIDSRSEHHFEPCAFCLTLFTLELQCNKNRLFHQVYRTSQDPNVLIGIRFCPSKKRVIDLILIILHCLHSNWREYKQYRSDSFLRSNSSFNFICPIIGSGLIHLETKAS